MKAPTKERNMKNNFKVKGLKLIVFELVSLAAVFSIVTQRSSPQTLWGGALRDDTKNGCEGDYT